MTTIPAVIPAAGRGTRLRPITRHVSKPMLPLGNRPVIDFAVREAHEAGCDPIVVVHKPDDQALRNYLEGLGDEFNITLAVQEEPRGLAHAMLQAWEHLDRPSWLAELLPDNVILNGPGIRALVGIDRSGYSFVSGTIQVSREKAHLFGNSGGYQVKEENQQGEVIVGLQEKGEGSFQNRQGPWPQRRLVARVLLPDEFFERASERDPNPETGEIDDVPIFRNMLQSKPALGVPINSEIRDMGTPEKYLALCSRYHEILRAEKQTD
ncbi:MAG: sugar phosphate nucleotidyltransferase [bacterium]